MRLHRVILAVAVTLGFAACTAPAPDEAVTEQGLLATGILPSPATLTFASRQVNTGPSAVQYVDVNPTGTATFYTNISVTGCQGFDVNVVYGGVGQECSTCLATVSGQSIVDQCPLPQVSTCYPTDYAQFSVAFNPTVAQDYSCTINISGSGVTTRTVTVTGTGTPPPKAVSLSRSSIPFGDVRVGTTSAPTTFVVQNTGGQNVTISNVTWPAGFAVTPGATTLAPGASQLYQVTCSPTSSVGYSGNLTFTHDAAGYPTTVALSCNGIDSFLNISPSPLAITTRVGEPLEAPIQISNAGSAPMALSSVAVSGTGITAVEMPTAMTLQPGQSVNATVRIDAAAAGDATGSLTVSYDGQMRTSSITATSLATSMALAPDGAYDFGAVCVGQSRTQHVALKAAEAGGFLVKGLSDPGGPFALSPTMLPYAIQGGGANELAFDVTVAPADIGEATGAIDIATDIPSATPRSLALSVTGLPAGVSATPAELDLGPSELGKTTLGSTIELTNCAEATVSLSNPRIEGDFPDDFAIVSAPDSRDVDANGKAQWLVVATPRAIGTRTAKFSVDYPGGTASVDLLANGVTEGPPTGGDEGGVNTSYYACSTGSASAAWPIALVLVPVLHRRKRRA